MRKERRTFDDTFKQNAVALLRGGRSIQSVADELQISKQLVESLESGATRYGES